LTPYFTTMTPFKCPYTFTLSTAPLSRTDEDGRFMLELRDYPELKTHQYYLVFYPDEVGYRWTGLYITMGNYKDGEVVDLGQIAINRAAP